MHPNLHRAGRYRKQRHQRRWKVFLFFGRQPPTLELSVLRVSCLNATVLVARLSWCLRKVFSSEICLPPHGFRRAKDRLNIFAPFSKARLSQYSWAEQFLVGGAVQALGALFGALWFMWCMPARESASLPCCSPDPHTRCIAARTLEIKMPIRLSLNGHFWCCLRFVQ